MRTPLFTLLGMALLSTPLPAAQLLRGEIYTTVNPAVLVEALAISDDGRVLGSGTEKALRAAFPQLKQISTQTLNGTVLPGLIDAHGHLMGLGLSLLRADLVDTDSVDAVRVQLAAKAKDLPDGAWLMGRGWDQNDWAVAEFPTAAMLDGDYPERPVWLKRIDGHAGWANSAALRAGGITRDSVDPDGGLIVRDANGEPTGVLLDGAMALVDKMVPPLDPAQARQALELAMRSAVANGLTGVHDAGVSSELLDEMIKLADAKALPLRITAWADGDRAALARLCAKGLYAHPGNRLRMRTLKLYADGALGSRGAALLADYSDAGRNRGLLIQSEEQLRAVLNRAADCGVQPAVHAIGDRANRIVLDAYASWTPAQRAALRPRIEHAQVVAPDDLPRFAQLGVIASMQPTHATSDMPWAGKRVGADRLRGAYAWRTLMDDGAQLALGSDFPVERVDPRLGLYAAVTRQDLSGMPKGGWLADQRLTIGEALAGFTTGAAYAGFAENEVGTLEAGKFADYIVVDLNPLKVPAARLATLAVRQTVVGGETVYSAEQLD